MENIEKFYINTKNALPHPIVKNFIEIQPQSGNAIDLGCGSGRDTIYLIKNNWNVLSIDKNNTEHLISDKLSNDDLSRFRFNMQNFENINLEKNNLVVANFSLPFCNKSHFNDLWSKISTSIDTERIFCW